MLLKVLFQLLLYFTVIPTGDSPSLVLTIKSSFQLGCCTCYKDFNVALFFQLHFSFICKILLDTTQKQWVISLLVAGNGSVKQQRLH